MNIEMFISVNIIAMFIMFICVVVSKSFNYLEEWKKEVKSKYVKEIAEQEIKVENLKNILEDPEKVKFFWGEEKLNEEIRKLKVEQDKLESLKRALEVLEK